MHRGVAYCIQLQSATHRTILRILFQSFLPCVVNSAELRQKKLARLNPNIRTSFLGRLSLFSLCLLEGCQLWLGRIKFCLKGIVIKRQTFNKYVCPLGNFAITMSLLIINMNVFCGYLVFFTICNLIITKKPPKCSTSNSPLPIFVKQRENI